ncbi:hypothetical protein EV356DRAFT_47206 [Viridothelium virens]|uniref:DUF2293 domain-containing protein n=1 Tax=Viridothelium virens TaxID=1048519 RepID=A0A6A6GTY0_VIRVR|nr:hypothetical protein EV356DRAFT_47206 [Viridothelium virens]
MTRADERGARHRSALSVNARTAKKKKSSYKVLYENVTQTKKKLRSAISHHVRSPNGYTFVPAGKYPDLTETCKEFSRKKGAKVYVVSAAPQQRRPEQVSHHIHRLGHHFQNEVLEIASSYLGYRQNGVLFWKNQDLNSSSRLATLLARESSHNLEETQQIKTAIRDLFPKIPENDLVSIAERAFQEGSGRVGTAAALTLERRVQLAVAAHIRHVYTDYDEQLRKATWQDARRHVEQACVDQLVKWRGEDDSDAHELEDIFREIIVIDDDDDESDEESSGTDEESSDDGSVQIISSPKEAHELADDDANQMGRLDHSRISSQPEGIFVKDLQDSYPRRAGLNVHLAGQSRTEGAPTRLVHIPERDNRMIISRGPDPRPFTDASGQHWFPLGDQSEPGHGNLRERRLKPATEFRRPILGSPSKQQLQKALPNNSTSEHDVPLPSVEDDIGSTVQIQRYGEVNYAAGTRTTKPPLSVATERILSVTRPDTLREPDVTTDEQRARKRARLSADVNSGQQSGSHSNAMTLIHETSNYVDLTSPKGPRIQEVDYRRPSGLGKSSNPMPVHHIPLRELQEIQVPATTVHDQRRSDGMERVLRRVTNAASESRSPHQSSVLSQVSPHTRQSRASADFDPVYSHTTLPAGNLVLPALSSPQEPRTYVPYQPAERVANRDFGHELSDDRQGVRRTNSDQIHHQERFLRGSALGLADPGIPHMQFRDDMRYEAGQYSEKIPLRARDPRLQPDTGSQRTSDFARIERSAIRGHFERMQPRYPNLQFANEREVVRQSSAIGDQQRLFSVQDAPYESTQQFRTHNLQSAFPYSRS